MGLESRLGLPSKEKVARAAVATLVFTAPIAGFIAKREISLRKTKKEQQDLAEKTRLEAIKVSQDSNNSGDSGFLFASGN